MSLHNSGKEYVDFDIKNKNESWQAFAGQAKKKFDYLHSVCSKVY